MGGGGWGGRIYSAQAFSVVTNGYKVKISAKNLIFKRCNFNESIVAICDWNRQRSGRRHVAKANAAFVFIQVPQEHHLAGGSREKSTHCRQDSGNPGRFWHLCL